MNTSKKIKRTAFAVALGLITTMLLELIAAFVAARFLQNDAAIPILSAAAVLLGCFAAAYAAGGKIYGIIAFIAVIALLFIIGAFIFKTGANGNSALITVAAGAAGALLGTLLAKNKK